MVVKSSLKSSQISMTNSIVWDLKKFGKWKRKVPMRFLYFEKELKRFRCDFEWMFWMSCEKSDIDSLMISQRQNCSKLSLKLSYGSGSKPIKTKKKHWRDHVTNWNVLIGWIVERKQNNSWISTSEPNLKKTRQIAMLRGYQWLLVLAQHVTNTHW